MASLSFSIAGQQRNIDLNMMNPDKEFIHLIECEIRLEVNFLI